jgi:CDP-glycerol glycerophosphotransferase (TagB/SpsB family)
MIKRIFIIADHGLALIYFLQSDVIPTLLKSGVEIILFSDDESLPAIETRYRQTGLLFEGIRLKQCENYFQTVDPFIQRCLQMLRWVGGSNRINVTALDGNYHLLAGSFSGPGKFVLPLLKMIIWLMRRSRGLRRFVVKLQNRYTPHIYDDLFEKFKPDMVVSRTPGWRTDRYILREAARRGIRTAAVTVGWDNPSSYSQNGAQVDYITCWSEIQKEEYILGSDWNPDRVFIGGVPAYDGYFRKEWVIPRQEYFRMHGLNMSRPLLSYACSFETLHPNFPNIAAIAELVNQNRLVKPCQLLIRLHPNHFRPSTRFEDEANRVRAYIKDMPNVHLVEPVSLGGGLGHYSGEDMDEKSSMMAWSDVFLTVYSTMVVETAIHDRPIISVTIDTAGGWNMKDVYSLPLTAIGDWPTHQRFRVSGAGRVAANQEQVCEYINFYLLNPDANREERRKFIQNECTYTDGCAGERTGRFLLSIMN